MKRMPDPISSVARIIRKYVKKSQPLLVTFWMAKKTNGFVLQMFALHPMVL